jgi:hypothetical protein
MAKRSGTNIPLLQPKQAHPLYMRSEELAYTWLSQAIDGLISPAEINLNPEISYAPSLRVLFDDAGLRATRLMAIY